MKRVLVVSWLFVALATSPAVAQRPPSRAELRTMLREAEGFMQAGQHEQAARRFMDLYQGMTQAQHPRASVALYNAGLAMSHLPGREEECLRTLRQFMDESTALTGDSQVRDFRTGAVEKIAEVEARMRANAQAAQQPAEQPTVEAPIAPVTAEPEPSPPVPIGPIVIGAGGALILAAVITGSVAISDFNAIDAVCAPSGYDATCRSEYADDAARVNELGIATDVLWVFGALTAGAGVVLLFVLDDGGSAETANNGPSWRARVGLGHLGLEGSF